MVNLLPSGHMEGNTPVLQLGWTGLAFIIALTLWGAFRLYREVYPKQWYSDMSKGWSEPRKFVKSRMRTK